MDLASIVLSTLISPRIGGYVAMIEYWRACNETDRNTTLAHEGYSYRCKTEEERLAARCRLNQAKRKRNTPDWVPMYKR